MILNSNSWGLPFYLLILCHWMITEHFSNIDFELLLMLLNIDSWGFRFILFILRRAKGRLATWHYKLWCNHHCWSSNLSKKKAKNKHEKAKRRQQCAEVKKKLHGRMSPPRRKIDGKLQCVFNSPFKTVTTLGMLNLFVNEKRKQTQIQACPRTFPSIKMAALKNAWTTL